MHGVFVVTDGSSADAVLETCAVVSVMKNRCAFVNTRRCRLPCIRGLSTCHVHTPECCVCCARNNSESTQLPCGHTFHASCISRWFEESRQCPLCRTYHKPTSIQIFYEQGAPRLDNQWLRPILLDLADRGQLRTHRVGILSTGELVQSNGEFIQFLWGV